MNREIAVSLGLARRLAGEPSYETVRDRLRDLIHDAAPSAETLRKWHRPDTVPKKPLDLAVFAALAVVYDIPLQAIHPELVDRFDELKDVVDQLSKRLYDLQKEDSGRYEGAPHRVAPFRRSSAA